MKYRFGFKGRHQLPLFMVWREYLDDTGNVEYAAPVFTLWHFFGFGYAGENVPMVQWNA